MKKTILNSDYYYSFILLYLVFCFLAFIFSVSFFGFRAFTTKTNSMNPTINTGSLFITKALSEYNPGDIITYYAQVDNHEEIITHRILSIGGNVYITKGDANVAVDREIVVPRLVIGKVILIYPYLGYLLGFAKTKIGVWLVILFPAFCIIAVEIGKIRRL